MSSFGETYILIPWCSISIWVCAQTARGRLMDLLDLPWLDLIICSLLTAVYRRGESRAPPLTDHLITVYRRRSTYTCFSHKQNKKIHKQLLQLLSLSLSDGGLFARAALRVYSILRPIKKQSTNADGGYKLGICTYTTDLHAKSTGVLFVLYTLWPNWKSRLFDLAQRKTTVNIWKSFY